jgi:multiple sugar transport system permease protein
MNERAVKKLLLSCGLLFVLMYTLVPIVWMIVISFNERPDFLTYERAAITLRHYADIITQENLHFLDFLRNSILVAGTAALLNVLIGSFASYAITRFKIPYKTLFVLIILGLSMFPQICIAGYLFKLTSAIGWVNTAQGLILPYVAWGLPLTFWIMISYFSKIPVELDEAAQIDGANRFYILTRIILPLALPGLLSTALLLFMFSFNEFLFALTLTTDHHARTVPVGIALFQGLHGELPWGTVMAASVISSIPVIVIALVFQKRIVKGLTHGAIKN